MAWFGWQVAAGVQAQASKSWFPTPIAKGTFWEGHLETASEFGG
jgi:hypothetical protein